MECFHGRLSLLDVIPSGGAVPQSGDYVMQGLQPAPVGATNSVVQWVGWVWMHSQTRGWECVEGLVRWVDGPLPSQVGLNGNVI